MIYLIIFIVLIIIVGILANREIAHDKERAERRKKETARFRSVFDEDVFKFPEEDKNKQRDDR